MAISPTDIPKKMSRDDLEWWIIFGICVANKPAKITEQKLRSFFREGLSDNFSGLSPFQRVMDMIARSVLVERLYSNRFGQYTRIAWAMSEAVKLDLDNLTVEALESIKGIGPKTARMIILYAQPDSNCVPLDTHVLKFLRGLGHKAPKSTPPAGMAYARLEKTFQEEAARRGMTVRDLDTQVWKSYAEPQAA